MVADSLNWSLDVLSWGFGLSSWSSASWCSVWAPILGGFLFLISIPPTFLHRLVGVGWGLCWPVLITAVVISFSAADPRPSFIVRGPGLVCVVVGGRPEWPEKQSFGGTPLPFFTSGSPLRGLCAECAEFLYGIGCFFVKNFEASDRFPGSFRRGEAVSGFSALPPPSFRGCCTAASGGETGN